MRICCQSILSILVATIIALTCEAQDSTASTDNSDDGKYLRFMLNKAEIRFNDDGGQTGAWDVESWYGDDRSQTRFEVWGANSLDNDTVNSASAMLYWHRPLRPNDAVSNVNLRYGIKYTMKPTGETFAYLGFAGTGPYSIATKYDVYVSEKGEFDQAVKATRDWHLTNRVALQAHGVLGFAFDDNPDLYIGSGFTDFEARLRLRYEVEDFFAPYIGLNWSTSIGASKELEQAAGFDPEDLAIMVGILSWN